MNNTAVAEVGAGGEVVIDLALRERLGVQPGYRAVQILSGEHVEIHFVPSRHSRSLLGAARPFIRRAPVPEEQWDEAVAQAIAEEPAVVYSFDQRFPATGIELRTDF